jgi:hypothetical protein
MMADVLIIQGANAALCASPMAREAGGYVQAAHNSGNAPNCVIVAPASIIGPCWIEINHQAVQVFIELEQPAALCDACDENFEAARLTENAGVRVSCTACDYGARVQNGIPNLMRDRYSFGFCLRTAERGCSIFRDGVSIVRGHLIRMALSRVASQNLVWQLGLMGSLIGSFVDAALFEPDRCGKLENDGITGGYSLIDVAYSALHGGELVESVRLGYRTMSRMMCSSEPDATSTQYEEGESEDGLEIVDHIRLNGTLIEFVTHTGHANGGKAFNKVALLLTDFAAVEYLCPGDGNHNLGVNSMTSEFARAYGEQRFRRKELGASPVDALPYFDHRVFKGGQISVDPHAVAWKRLMSCEKYGGVQEFDRSLALANFDKNTIRDGFTVSVGVVI